MVPEDPLVAWVSDPRRSRLIHSRRAREEPPDVKLEHVVQIVAPAVDGVLGEVHGLPARGSRASGFGIDGMWPECAVGVVPAPRAQAVGKVRAAGGGRGVDRRRRQNDDDQEGGLCARGWASRWATRGRAGVGRVGSGEPRRGRCLSAPEEGLKPTTLYLWQPQDFNLCEQRNTLATGRGTPWIHAEFGL